LTDKVVLAGGLAQKPGYAGHAWVFVHWLLGFRRLGLDALFVDQLTPGMGAVDEGVHYLASVMRQFELSGDYCLLGSGGESIAGVSRALAMDRTRGAVLINVNGYLRDKDLLEAATLRVYLDIDPGFSQMWREQGLHDSFAGHDVFVTIAEKIGRPGCRIPTCGLDWITTRQPVVLDLWTPHTDGGGAFTSVGVWRGPFAPVEYDGTTFGLRVHEFRKFVELPRMTGERFELALDIDDAEVGDVQLLRHMGWRLLDPRRVVGSVGKYQGFIAGSKAELMIAKNMYVETRGGWFSDRSAAYLASGRPVVAEDTGLAGLYPVGEGLLTFRTVEEAAAGIEAVCAQYPRHARAAREIAESAFDSDRVLTALWERLAA